MQRDIDELAAGTAGSLIVASSMAIGTYLLPRVMTSLRAKRRGADITVQIAEPAAALRSTELGEVDFTVAAWADDTVPVTLVAEKLWDEPIILCASVNGPPYSDSVTLAEALTLPLVGTPTSVAFHRTLLAQLRPIGVNEVPAVIRLGHAEAIKEAVAENGWASLNLAYTMVRDVEAGRLRVVPISDVRLVETVVLYHRTAKYFTPLQSTALDALRELGARKREEHGQHPPL
jgi:DNA-binding transcriptional LysR family regulator